MSNRLWRRPVALRAEADGRLLPIQPPGAPEPAGDETYLHRDIAELVSADPEAIAAFASRHGPLHPAPIDLAELEPLLEWKLGDWLREWRRQLAQLRRWVATGGTAEVVGASAPGAYVVGAVANLDEVMLARLERIATGGTAIPDEEAIEVIRAGWTALTELAGQSAEVLRLHGLGTVMVNVPPPPGATPVRLRRAFNVLDRFLERAGRDMSFVRGLAPGWLGGLVAQYSVTPGMEMFPFARAETVEEWRSAGRELGLWRQTIRDLRGQRASWATRSPSRGELLRQLRIAAGIPGTLANDIDPATLTEKEAFRSELTSLLIRRLRQEGTWPRPGTGQIACTMGRALWSLWSRLTGTSPPRLCSWKDCGEELPENARRDRRWCDRHQAAAARDRAKLSYARRAESRQVSGIQQGGGRPSSKSSMANPMSR